MKKLQLEAAALRSGRPGEREHDPVRPSDLEPQSLRVPAPQPPPRETESR